MSVNGVKFEVLAERPVVRNDHISDINIALNLTTNKSLEAAAATQNLAINLCVVIDRSESMGGEKIEQAKKSCVDIYESLNPSDRFTVLAFDDEVISVVNPQTSPASVKERILSLEARGQTNLSNGWYLGLLELQTYATERHLNRLILLSDGQANLGEQKPSVLGAESSRARDEAAITTSAIGIGTDFQEDILDALARQSGGRFWFIGEARIEDIIKEEFSGALSVLLERPGVSIELPAGVSVQKELNSLPKIADRYRLRPIKANDSLGIAMRLRVDPLKVEQKELRISATLFDGAGVVQRAETKLPLVSVHEYVQSIEDTQVAAIVNTYVMATSDEEMVKQLDEGNTSTMLKMLQSGSDLMKQLEAKLAGAAAISWDAAEAQEKAEAERRLGQLRMEMAENEALSVVFELIDLMKGLGQEARATKLLTSGRKMSSQRMSRSYSTHHRSVSEDWAAVEVLKSARQETDDLMADFPHLRNELQTICGRLDEQLERFS